MYAHASVGVIHVRPILDLRKSEDISRFEHISMDTFKLVKKYGGSWSGEHGDGLVRSFYNQEFFGEKIYHAFRDIKKLFDPNNLMNPGKIVDSPPITHNLRYGTKYSDQKVETHFHFRQDQSFESAVHMCTGVGECRKLMGGTMCPSFKATRDEEHSTRGRANALRQAMSGQLGPAGLGNKRLHQVMDLCISCKACKSECPSNVDMAKLKGEVNQAYFDTHGLTLRDRLISGSPAMARKIAGKFARLVNYIQSTKIFRGTIQQWVGFDKNRILPSYASQTFSDWFKKYYVPNQGRDLALYVDTYMNYHEPQIGISAVKLLNKLDYNVVLADIGCCQRPNISHGLLRKAKMPSTALTNALMEFLEMDIPVIVCEPSCYSSLVDDIPDLIDDPLLASKLNKGIFMIDQFIYQEILSKKIQSNLSPAANNIVLHGHCHQKALYGTESMKSSFHELTGEEMQEIQSGCCGMAGSFGYEKEHHKISEKMGSAILFPAINNLDKDTEIIACGFSCRHQIRHFTGRKAKHWVQAFDL